MSERPLRFALWFERIGLAGALAAAALILLASLNRHQPLEHWLFWRYASYWGLSLLFNLSCLLLGLACWNRLANWRQSLLERLALAWPLGVLLFFLLTFLCGLLGWLGPVFAVVAPLALGLVGFAGTRGALGRTLRHLRHLVPSRSWRPGWPAWGLHCAGFGALALIYFSILSPENVGYDARWYHLPIAEQYADAGKIFRFDEGWVMGSYPQLASVIYSWAYQLPGLSTFDQIALCAHLEFSLFLGRLLALPCLVLALLPRQLRAGRRLWSSWVCVFLFPGLFLYDSALGAGADHIAAFFVAPMLLCGLRVIERPGWRSGLAVAIFTSGALLTKYTALLVAIPLILLVVGALLLRLVRRARRPRGQELSALGAFALGGIALTAPHWLKNWIWYGDPIYPQLHALLTLRPWNEAANVPYHFDIAVPWHASRDLEGVLEALRVTASFAFVHHDWPDLHGKAPVFGFLFSLLALTLPFLRRAGRLWLAFALGHAGVFSWAMISWQDRYLQILVPWMCTAVAAVIFVAWRMSVITRALVTLLIGLQVVWGADVYFFTTHRMIGSPVEASVRLLNTGRLKQYEERFDVFARNTAVDQALPEGAKPLVHESRQTIAMKRHRVFDRPGTQGSLYYESVSSAARLYRQLGDLGVTHLVFGQPEGISTLAADLVFYDFVLRQQPPARRAGAFRVTELRPPVQDRSYSTAQVAVFDCQGMYEGGLYPLPDLSISPFDPRPRPPRPLTPLAPSTLSKLLRDATFVVLGEGCKEAPPRKALRQFSFLTRRGSSRLYVRPRK